MRTAYKCRAHPNPEQAAALSRTFGCVRLVWNKTLNDRNRRYKTENKGTSYRETDATLTIWKRSDVLGFLSEVSCVPLQQTLRHQHSAFQNFFSRRSRYPRFKSRTGRQSAHCTRSAFRMRGGSLTLAKMSTPLPFTWSFTGVDVGELNPATVIVSREPDGRWYVSFAVDVRDSAAARPANREIGLDLGLRNFVTTSDGTRVPRPRSMDRKARNLGCRTRHDRDLNAAKNILAAGRAVARGFSGDACGADVRRQGPSLPLSAVNQEAHAETLGS
ncbi:RNA-guided endonuclease InsQ/TnpB family protein [Lentzea guizhouensis]|uniref:RNA-guided endonuclease InsQ/TnpB family protein n=1 Tax=Lentzea guizhouensis TaxID=1586287 RepID=UPI0008FF66F5|nr:RNA-guided endonuclease TnpB family protein [Lentzea guizhouensis]